MYFGWLLKNRLSRGFLSTRMFAYSLIWFSFSSSEPFDAYGSQLVVFQHIHLDKIGIYLSLAVPKKQLDDNFTPCISGI